MDLHFQKLERRLIVDSSSARRVFITNTAGRKFKSIFFFHPDLSSFCNARYPLLIKNPLFVASSGRLPSMAANQQPVDVNNILNQSSQLLNSFGSPGQMQAPNGQQTLKFATVPGGRFGEPAQSFSLNRTVRQPSSSQANQQQQQAPPSSFQSSSFQQPMPPQQPLPPQQSPLQQQQQQQSYQQPPLPQQAAAPPQTYFNPSRFLPPASQSQTYPAPDYNQQQQPPKGVRFYNGQPTIDSPYNGAPPQQTNLFQAIETPSNNEDNLKRLFSKSRESTDESSSKRSKAEPKRESIVEENEEEEEGGEWEEVSEEEDDDEEEPVLLASEEEETAEETGDPVSGVREFDGDKPVVENGDDLQNLLRNATSSRFAPPSGAAKPTPGAARFGLFNRDRSGLNNAPTFGNMLRQQQQDQNQDAQQEAGNNNNIWRDRQRDYRGRFSRMGDQQQGGVPPQDENNARQIATQQQTSSVTPAAKPKASIVTSTCNYFKGIDPTTGAVDTSARNRRIGLAIVALIVIIAGVGGLLYWFIKGRKKKQKSGEDDEQEEDAKPIVVETAPPAQKQAGGLADVKKQERAKMEQQLMAQAQTQATPSAPPAAIAAPPVNPFIPPTMDYDKLAEMSRNKAALAMAASSGSNINAPPVSPSVATSLDALSQENMVL